MSEVNSSNIENQESVLNSLQSQIPESLNIDLPSREAFSSTGEDSIQEANNKAQTAILKLLKDNEEERRKRRKPVLIFVSVLVVLQLVAFNVIIGSLVLGWWGTENIEIAIELMDFLKYYIGAVLVELLGMLAVIITDTFKSYSEPLIKTIASYIWGSAEKKAKVNGSRSNRSRESNELKENDRDDS